MILVGIDPGLTGGIAAVEDGRIVMVEKMPVMPSPVAGRKMVDGRALAAALRGLQQRGPVQCVVEQVGARPGQSVVAMFSFGQAHGIVLGVLAALGVGYTLVTPQRWQKSHGLSADKAQTIGWAQRRWPELDLKKSDDGLADALAIATS